MNTLFHIDNLNNCYSFFCSSRIEVIYFNFQRIEIWIKHSNWPELQPISAVMKTSWVYGMKKNTVYNTYVHLKCQQYYFKSSEILKRLEKIYCDTMGIEYMYIFCPKKRTWIRERIEKPGQLQMSADKKKLILSRLIRATAYVFLINIYFFIPNIVSCDSTEVSKIS